MKQTSAIKELIEVSKLLKPLCSPLNSVGIHTFTALINYDDNTQINLSNKPQWIADYYDLKLHDSSLYDTNPTLFTTGYSLWPKDSHLPIFRHGLTHFDSGFGITICHRHKDHTAFYFFSGSNKNAALINFFVNNLSFLETYIYHFTQNMSRQIAKSKLLGLNQQKKTTESVVNDLMISSLLKRATSENETIFLLKKKFISLKKFNKEISLRLTPRQKEVVYWFAQGKSAKQTAEILQISTRTVERHFEDVRKKTGLKNKQEIFNAFYESTI
ncbi:Regulatory protein SdiA [Legionella bozemanae]|uniref:HTH luxR-type domain-containing protein n=2 Tax=Legionella bozemanae TaxID=447 RepID=A0A0W0RRG8_LEGBO|nr:hypothetical protein Lboz_2301 [Legionella bozemanae]STO33476.1 Regulatory protein SdiA [Legionella bozemanae]